MVYVTANPFITEYASDSFYRLEETWKEELGSDNSHYDPERVLELSKETLQKYPNKRLVMHLMQPHHPFIGSSTINEKDYEHLGDEEGWEASPYRALENGIYDKDEVWRGYRENLEYVIDDVLELAEEFPGKTVVSSDHGNMIGERSWPIPIKMYDHGSGMGDRRVTEVPWLVIEDSERPTIEEGEVTEPEEEIDEEAINERLEQLGYR